MLVKSGATSVTTYFVLRDSTNHLPHTTLTVTDIDLYYTEFRLAESAKIDCTALAAANSAYTSGGAFHCGHGVYRIDWPDLAFDGAIGTTVQLIVVCTGADTTFLEVELSAPTDAVAIGSNASAANNANSAFSGGVYNVGAGGIVAASVAAGGITSNSFAAGAINAAAIATGAIDADAIADSAIDAGSIATGAITSAKFAAGAIDAAAIADNAIDAASIATGAITSAKFAPDAITATVIADNAIDAGAIADNAIDAGAIATGAITSAKFASGAITSTVMAAGSITNTQLTATGTALTAIPYNIAWDTNIQTQAEEALRTYDLDHLSNAGSAPAPTSGSYMDKLMNKTAGGGGYDQTTDSLEAIVDNSVTASGLQDVMFGGARPTGSVVDDVLNSATTFETDLDETSDNHWNYAYLMFTSSTTGNLTGQVRRITGYNGTTKFVTCDAFTEEPAAGDDFILVNI